MVKWFVFLLPVFCFGQTVEPSACALQVGITSSGGSATDGDWSSSYTFDSGSGVYSSLNCSGASAGWETTSTGGNNDSCMFYTYVVPAVYDGLSVTASFSCSFTELSGNCGAKIRWNMDGVSGEVFSSSSALLSDSETIIVSTGDVLVFDWCVNSATSSGEPAYSARISNAIVSLVFGDGDSGSGDCLECCEDLVALLTAIEVDTTAIASDTSHIRLTQLPQLIESLDNVEADTAAILDALTNSTETVSDTSDSDLTEFTTNTETFNYEIDDPTLEAMDLGVTGIGDLGSGSGWLDSGGDLTVPLSDFNSVLASAGVVGGESFEDFEIDLSPDTNLRNIIGTAILIVGTISVVGFAYKAIT